MNTILKKVLLIFTFVISHSAFSIMHAQVGINNDNSQAHESSMLDVKSTDKGLLIPRMSTQQRSDISNPAKGLLVFDNETSSFWFYNGAIWKDLSVESQVPDPQQPIPLRHQGSIVWIHPTDNASEVDWVTAQNTCNTLFAFGLNDWYLPSNSELDAMYKQSYLITGLSQTVSVKYWSNTEYDSEHAFTQRMDYGAPDPDLKADIIGHSCRCIRKDTISTSE